MAADKPDWNFWLRDEVFLDDAVALSLGVEPRDIKPYRYLRGAMLYKAAPPEEMRERLALARRCIYDALPAAAPQDGEPRVRLRQFVGWAIGLGWQLPRELADYGNSEINPTPETDTVDLNTAVTATLAELGQPGRDIAWKTFCDSVRSRCSVKMDTRGYGDKSIRRAVKAQARGKPPGRDR